MARRKDYARESSRGNAIDPRHDFSGLYIVIPIIETDAILHLYSNTCVNPVGTAQITRPKFQLHDTRREIHCRIPIYRQLLMERGSIINLARLMCEHVNM